MVFNCPTYWIIQTWLIIIIFIIIIVWNISSKVAVAWVEEMYGSHIVAKLMSKNSFYELLEYYFIFKNEFGRKAEPLWN